MVAEIILLILFTGYILNILVKRVVKRLDSKREQLNNNAFDKLKQDINEQDIKIPKEDVSKS